MRKYSCSACGAELTWSGAVPYGVCGYCQSLLVRRDVNLESIGKVAEVPDDFSPLQLGAAGYFDGQQFGVIGRVRKTWDEGSWNEWCVLLDDQRTGWLAEAQGDWVMLFEQTGDALAQIPAPEQARRIGLDDKFTIAGQRFTVTDIKQVHYTAAEGELAAFEPGKEGLLSIDLRGNGLAFATFEIDADGVHVFSGRFVEFDECRFSGLRELEGW